MAWIELHQSVWEHRKTLLLADALGIDELYAAAHMAKLWCWALDSAEDGDLTGVPARIIARGAGWTGDAEAFVEAAIEAGYIDRVRALSGGESGGESGRYRGDNLQLHDWFDYAGQLVKTRQQAREDGAKGNHKRWHADRGLYDPNCKYCREENPEMRNATAFDRLPSGGESGGDIGTPSGGESHRTVPNHTVPIDDDDDANAHTQAREAVHERLRDAPTWGHWLPHKPVLDDYADELGWPIVLEAMDRTLEHSASRSWAYAKRIFDRWSERKVRSLDDIAALDAQFEAQKQVAAGNGTGRAGPGRRRVPQGIAELQDLYERAKAEEEAQSRVATE